MKKFKNHTLSEYLKELSVKKPVPGGGSVAALTGALAAGLLSMVANYSVGRKISRRDAGRIQKALDRSEKLRLKFLDLVDLDSQAYLKLVASKGKPAHVRAKASREAQKVPEEVAKLCYASMELIPVLVEKGSPYLLSDVEVAVELLEAAFKSALINIRVNQ